MEKEPWIMSVVAPGSGMNTDFSMRSRLEKTLRVAQAWSKMNSAQEMGLMRVPKGHVFVALAQTDGSHVGRRARERQFMDGRGSVHQPSLLEIMRDLDQLRTWRNPEAAPPEKVRVWADRMLDIGEGFAKEALEKGWVVEVVLDEAAPYLDEMNPQERFNARSVKEKELGPAGRVFWQDEEQARLGADQEAKEIGQAVVQSRAPEKKKARI